MRKKGWMNRWGWLCVWLFLGIGNLHGQESGDTINTTYTLLQSGDREAAYQLISTYYQHHPSDPAAARLAALTAYWSGHPEVSEKIFGQALQMEAGNLSLALEYADMLTQTLQLRKADSLLSRFLKQSPAHPGIWRAKAQIAWYRGDVNKAGHFAARANELDAGNEEVQQFLEEIRLAKAIRLDVYTHFTSDDQPLESLDRGLRLEKKYAALLNPSLDISIPYFVTENKSTDILRAHIGNEFVFNEKALRIRMNAGVMKFLLREESQWTADFYLVKKLIKPLNASFRWTHQPYLSTVQSLDRNLAQNNYTLNLHFTEHTAWKGEFLLSTTDFSVDKNRLYTLAAWVFLPPLKLEKASFSLGYAFSYANAEENRFTAEESLEDIISQGLYLEQIHGIYDPYFTPRKQSIHSLLGMIQLHPGKKFGMDASMQYGIRAQAEYPYLYLDARPSGKIFLARDYASDTFTPFQLKASLRYKLCKVLEMRGDIWYQETLFYHSQGGGLTVKWIIL